MSANQASRTDDRVVWCAIFPDEAVFQVTDGVCNIVKRETRYKLTFCLKDTASGLFVGVVGHRVPNDVASELAEAFDKCIPVWCRRVLVQPGAVR